MKASWDNILESGTVTVTSEHPGYPAYRLYDRRFGRQWAATSTATQTIQVDQGATPRSVDLLVVPEGHALGGCTLAWEHSVNGSTWAAAMTSWAQSGSGLIQKQTTAPITARYWRLVISGASSAPQAAEVWMGLLTTFSNPDFPGKYGLDPAVVRVESTARVPHYVTLGAAAKVFSGQVKLIDATELASVEAWVAAWSGGRPFFFVDARGSAWFAEFTEQPLIEEVSAMRYNYSLSLRQVF